MNSSKRERREDQLMKKAEKLAEYASEIVMQSDTQMLIDGHPYVLVKNYRDGFRTDKLKERFSQILTKYDYIVGDWGYDQLRLRGFYESGSKKGTPSQNIDRLMDYLYENCNFGCAYFVLHNLDVQKPKRSGARIVSAQSSANANDNVKTMFMRKKSMKFIAENLIATVTRETK